MTSEHITEEAVEAAGLACMTTQRHTYGAEPLKKLPHHDRAFWMKRGRLILEAALPHISPPSGGEVREGWKLVPVEDYEKLIASEEILTGDIRWSINVLLEKIACEFETHDTYDIWRSDAAARVRSYKHDLSALPVTESNLRRVPTKPEPEAAPVQGLTEEERVFIAQLEWHPDEIVTQLLAIIDRLTATVAAGGGQT